MGQLVNFLWTLEIAHSYSNLARLPECEASLSAFTYRDRHWPLPFYRLTEEQSWSTLFRQPRLANVEEATLHQGPSLFCPRRRQTRFNSTIITSTWILKMGEWQHR